MSKSTTQSSAPTCAAKKPEKVSPVQLAFLKWRGGASLIEALQGLNREEQEKVAVRIQKQKDLQEKQEKVKSNVEGLLSRYRKILAKKFTFDSGDLPVETIFNTIVHQQLKAKALTDEERNTIVSQSGEILREVTANFIEAKMQEAYSALEKRINNSVNGKKLYETRKASAKEPAPSKKARRRAAKPPAKSASKKRDRSSVPDKFRKVKATAGHTRVPSTMENVETVRQERKKRVKAARAEKE